MKRAPVTGCGSDDNAGLIVDVDGCLDFGFVSVGETSAPKTVKVTNPGPGPVSIADLQLGGDGVFDIVGDNCEGETLDEDEECEIDLTFTPTSNIQFSGTLNIISNAGSSPTTVCLKGAGGGVGSSCGLTVCPAVDFGCQVAGVESAPETTTISNPTGATKTIYGIQSKSPYFHPDVSGITFPYELAAGDTLPIDVTFNGPFQGAYFGKLEVISDAVSSPDYIQLTAMVGCTTGKVLGFDVYGPVARREWGNVGVDCYEEPGVAILVGLGDQTVTVTNITSTNPQWSVQPGFSFPVPVNPGEIKKVPLIFNPSSLGSKTADISVVSDATTTVSSPIPVVGAGVRDTPIIAASPVSINLGTWDGTGLSPTATLTVTNVGPSTCTFVDVVGLSSPFSATLLGGNLNKRGCGTHVLTIGLSFSIATPGSHSDLYQIRIQWTNASGVQFMNTLTLSIQGTITP